MFPMKEVRVFKFNHALNTPEIEDIIPTSLHQDPWHPTQIRGLNY